MAGLGGAAGAALPTQNLGSPASAAQICKHRWAAAARRGDGAHAARAPRVANVSRQPSAPARGGHASLLTLSWLACCPAACSTLEVGAENADRCMFGNSHIYTNWGVVKAKTYSVVDVQTEVRSAASWQQQQRQQQQRQQQQRRGVHMLQAHAGQCWSAVLRAVPKPLPACLPTPALPRAPSAQRPMRLFNTAMHRSPWRHAKAAAGSGASQTSAHSTAPAAPSQRARAPRCVDRGDPGLALHCEEHGAAWAFR